MDRRGEPWTKADLAQLKEMFSAGHTRETASALGRTEVARLRGAALAKPQSILPCCRFRWHF